MKKNDQSKEGCYFDIIMDNSSDIIIGISRSFSIIFFNKVAISFFGIDQKDALDNNWFELFATKGFKVPITSNYFDNPILQTLQSDTLDKNQDQCSLEWKIIPIRGSEHRKTESAILLARIICNEEESNVAKNLNQIVNCTPGSLYWKDLEGRYLGCNMFMVKTAGLSSQRDIIGKTDFDLWPENAEKLQENDQYVINTGETVFPEEEVKIPNGENMYFTGVKMPLKNENNEVIGVIGNSLDITKLKKTEKALRKAKEGAESANQIKADFIHNMEHDIRTPFAGIYGMANILARQETDPEKKENLTDIAQCAKELMDYCNNILDFSKIETSSLPILSKSFNLDKLIDRIITIETPAAKIKDLKLILDYDANLPNIIMGDPYRVKCMLINLISNAVKFTNEGYIKTSIRLSKTEHENRRVIVKFVVADSGIGISDEKKDFIYERFVKIAPSNIGLYKGQGLGLRIVKQFVNEMDGDIHLKSELGKGSIFTVLLPFNIPLTDDVIDGN